MGLVEDGQELEVHNNLEDGQEQVDNLEDNLVDGQVQEVNLEDGQVLVDNQEDNLEDGQVQEVPHHREEDHHHKEEAHHHREEVPHLRDSQELVSVHHQKLHQQRSQLHLRDLQDLDPTILKPVVLANPQSDTMKMAQ